MNIFTVMRQHVLGIIQEMADAGELPQGLVTDAITTEPPREAAHGDMATNAALVIAKPAQKNPREIAANLAKRLEKLEAVASVEVAGPGFINIRLKDWVWQKVAGEILASGIGFGNSDLGEQEKVNIEFVSANPTGPMHIGHARGAIFGDALARLLQKAGYNVTREYYINDAGNQIEALARSAYLRYREACGETIGPMPEGLYPGDYLIPTGEALKEHYDRKLLSMAEEEWLPLVRQFSVDAMMTLIRNDLLQLGVEHDVFTSEAALHKRNMVQRGLEVLEKKGLIYRGVLEPPKGMKPEDWEAREQTLFKATQFGDDVDRPIQKSDGTWTYFASDIAYHLDKLERGFDHMLLELGIDHGGYEKRMKAAVAALSDSKAKLEIKFHDMVKFLKSGVAVKMSKRAGTFETVGDVVDAVGKDILRFVMLTRKNDMVLEFDLDKVKEQSKDNPVFYVQYAHARARSVWRNTLAEMPEAINILEKNGSNVLLHLTEAAFLDVIKLLASWPRIVEAAARTYEPHRITFYLQDVAAAFHGLWNKGKEDPSLRFIDTGNAEKTAARLALVKAVQTVVASGLCVFNVEPVEEMR